MLNTTNSESSNKATKPFHRQAKGRPVAGRLSRAVSSVDLLTIFFGIATLDKRPATSAIGGLSEAMVGSGHAC